MLSENPCGGRLHMGLSLGGTTSILNEKVPPLALIGGRPHMAACQFGLRILPGAVEHAADARLLPRRNIRHLCLRFVR
jgi:hypothetical protein